MERVLNLRATLGVSFSQADERWLGAVNRHAACVCGLWFDCAVLPLLPHIFAPSLACAEERGYGRSLILVKFHDGQV